MHIQNIRSRFIQTRGGKLSIAAVVDIHIEDCITNQHQAETGLAAQTIYLVGGVCWHAPKLGVKVA